MGLLTNLRNALIPSSVSKGALEGQYRPGPYLINEGWLPPNAPWNFWQLGMDPQGFNHVSMVEACVGAYAQTIAMCPGDHWLQEDEADGRERVVTSALSRILRTPNDYQSISDFLLNLVRNLYLDGNAYAIALRNNRYEISELHLMNSRHSAPRIGVDGDIFYSVGGNEIIQRRLTGNADSLLLVPQRDILHVRLNTPVHPLKGESPIRAAALDMATSGAMSAQQLAFFTNQARPSYVLSTDQALTKESAQLLRERWNEQAQGMAQGGTPILSNGLKPIPLSVNAQDAQLAEVMKMSNQNIALAFRIPLAMLGFGGSGSGGSAGATTEPLMNQWIASGLGFALNHIEESFGQKFGLYGQPTEYVEFSTDVLERSSMKDRIAALSEGVRGGIYAINEARRIEQLPDVEFGDEPRVQQQLVPLSAAGKIPAPAPAAPGAPPAPAQDAPAADTSADGEKEIDFEQLVRRFRASQNIHSAISA